MKLNFGFPLNNQIPNLGVQEIPLTDVAGGQSNVVIATVNLAPTACLVKALVFGYDTVAKEIAAYELSALVRNIADRAVKATGTLTSSGTFTDGQTVVIGGKTYTFQTTLTNVDGNVLIGADQTASHANLKAAINLEAGAGTTYAAAMTLHPTVTATSATGTTTVVQAKSAGTAGNSIATTDTLSNVNWGAATLAGGVDPWALVGSVNSVAFEEDSGWAATITVNASSGVAEIKVTADGSNITQFSGACTVIPLV